MLGRLSPHRARRRAAWCGLLMAVSIAHWWVGGQLPDSRIGEGAANEDGVPAAIDVAFVRELAPTAPPVHMVPRTARPRAARAPRRAASAAAPASASASASATEPAVVAEAASAAASAVAEVMAEAMVEPAASAPPLAQGMPAVAEAASAPAVPPAATDASAPAPVAFDWPPSTRLSYTLLGNYRGPLHGTAQVEWLRDGPRYQVRLEVHLALVVTRRMLSDGVLGPDGLSPRRYDEVTEMPLRETRRLTVLFEPDRIVLANGKVNDPVPGVQDTASQFVQMTWLFLTQPERLRVGQTVEFPLALPRRVGRWTYEVAEQAALPLPFGEVSAFHLVPRAGVRRPNELAVDFWMAPSLQYLPVKITIRQDAESYVELSLDKPPLQAAPATPAR